MDEYYCTKCGAILNDQHGFDPNGSFWRCTECGQVLTGDDVYDGDVFKGIAWFCDSCGAFLNCQTGFSDIYGLWECTECSYINTINEDNIIVDSEPEFVCPNCGAALDFQPYFNKYAEDWECTYCEAYLHHDYCFEEYQITQSENEPENDEVLDSDEFDDEEYDDCSNLSYSSSQNDPYNESHWITLSGDLRDVYVAKNSSKFSHAIRLLRIFGVVAVIVAIITFVFCYEIKLLIPVGHDSSDLLGKQYDKVVNILEKSGFSNIKTNEIDDLHMSQRFREGVVSAVKIGFDENFSASKKYPSNFPVLITYHTLEKFDLPISSKEAKGENYQKVIEQLKSAGFRNISTEIQYDIITGWLSNDGDVEMITINGEKKFSAGDQYRADAEIVITYHTYRKYKP